MTAVTSVRDKALLLQNEVRRLEVGAQGEGQAQRIARRVTEIQAALADLSGHARAARALQRHTTAAAVSLSWAGVSAPDLPYSAMARLNSHR